MDGKLINVGFGNVVRASRIVAVVNPGSSPSRKLKDDARQEKRLIDMTEGRRTRAMVILDTGHLILSAVQPETIAQRFASLAEGQEAQQPRGPVRVQS